MVDVLVTAAARRDLRDAWFWGVETWGIGQADRYSAKLEAGLLRLADHPCLGPKSDIAPGLRRLIVEHHVAYYRVEPAAVLVLRVLHGAMDAPSHLPDDA